jgi:Conserved hypothetical protein 698
VATPDIFGIPFDKKTDRSILKSVLAIGYFAAPYVARVIPIPSMVIALVVGIALNPLAAGPAVQPGMDFCVKTLLRWAVALLGLRVGLGDIAALGAETAILIVHCHGRDGRLGFYLRALERSGSRFWRAGRGRNGGVRRVCNAGDVDRRT